MKRPSTRGYTAVELLMALAVFAIGISGIISLEKVTVVANQHAKNLAIATQIVQSWKSQLTVDAALWNNPSPATARPDDLDQTGWLTQADSQKGVWFQPAYIPERLFGPAFDALGNVVTDPKETQQIQFCTHLRLTRVYPSDTGAGLIRAEVRVFWLRDGQADGQFCNATTSTPTAIGQAITTYHFVYQTTAITQQTLS
jgi:prepilin-type N-terminal cleavage/methylation domain-containing protein